MFIVYIKHFNLKQATHLGLLRPLLHVTIPDNHQ